MTEDHGERIETEREIPPAHDDEQPRKVPPIEGKIGVRFQQEGAVYGIVPGYFFYEYVGYARDGREKQEKHSGDQELLLLDPKAEPEKIIKNRQYGKGEDDRGDHRGPEKLELDENKKNDDTQVDHPEEEVPDPGNDPAPASLDESGDHRKTHQGHGKREPEKKHVEREFAQFNPVIILAVQDDE